MIDLPSSHTPNRMLFTSAFLIAGAGIGILFAAKKKDANGIQTFLYSVAGAIILLGISHAVLAFIPHKNQENE